jgi:hypothetical protein
MANHRVVDDQMQERLRDLHSRGFGRNAIARELGIAAGTVTLYAQELGLSFERGPGVKAATAARKADAAALRSELELQLLEDAQKLRAQVWQPHTYIDHGGRDFTKVTWTQDEPSPVDKLKLMQAAGIALDRSIKLASLDKDDEVEAAKSMLVALFEQFDLVVEQQGQAS